ncbi:MAG TPA: hypothetical protein VHW60_02695 [Caulobacteraceae bacterium]|jgi:hypothetical protein|nr:hypothetical protein [Caulobacteraceae bacterium]
MSALSEEIAAFDRSKADLEAGHFGEWVVFRDAALVGLYASFEEAASDAVGRFDKGPYLIRQVGAAPVNLPASVIYRPAHAPDPGRV